jgi:hypothetical protein
MTKIIVRPAQGDDIPWMMDQLQGFSEFFGTRLKLFPDTDTAQGILDTLIAKHVVLVSECDTELTGFIAGILGPHFFNPKILVLTELLWWVAETHRGGRSGALLFSEFMETGKRECADWVVMTVEAKSPVNPHTLEKRGFHLQEQSYLLERAG